MKARLGQISRKYRPVSAWTTDALHRKEAMRFVYGILLGLVLLFGAASQSSAVVLTSDDEMYRHELKDAEARARDFERLQKEHTADHKSEAHEIEQYREKNQLDDKLREKERTQYIERRRNRPQSVSEDVLEARWNAEQEKLDELQDKDRGHYISTQHRAQIAISENPGTRINPMTEYDLQDPKTPALTDYLKAHPVEGRKKIDRLSPNGSIQSPGAEKLSSPPPGGDSF